MEFLAHSVQPTRLHVVLMTAIGVICVSGIRS